MLALAEHYNQGFLAADQIAQAQNLSLKYLENLLSSLKTAGLIISRRGMYGGYALARSPDEISLFDILVQLEDALDIVYCTEDGESCDRNGVCSTQEVWTEIKNAVEGILRKTTLGDLLARQNILVCSHE